jgi:hypothetical protein
MAIHLTIVGFGKEPDLSLESLLQYCGTDPEVAGKTVNGSTYYYKVKTKHAGVEIFHVAIRDTVIDSPNLSLIFTDAFPTGTDETDPLVRTRAELIGNVLGETAIRCGGALVMREVEGMFEDGKGNMSYLFKNVHSVIEADLAQGERAEIYQRNKN